MTNTIKFSPTSLEDANAIKELLNQLNRENLKLHSGNSFSITPILQSWSVTEAEVSVTFYPGVIETLGRELSARELIKAAGNSVSH